MIKRIQGKDVSVRTPNEDVGIFQQRYNALSPEEKRVFQAIIADLAATTDTNRSLRFIMESIEYERKPVSLEEFLFSDYYIGHAGKMLYPRLIDDLFELFSGGYYLVVLGGAIGYGKTFFVSIALLRILYLLSCMRNPQVSYGLAEGSVLSIVNMSITVKLAQKVLFEGLTGILNESPYFKDDFPFEKTMTELRFPKNIWVAPVSSSDTSVLGLHTIAACIDETNFLDFNPQTKVALSASHKVYSNAETLFNAIMRRMKSRYMQVGGVLPGMLFVVSSERTPDDFTKQLIRNSRDDSGVFVRNYALWETKTIFQNSKKFRVLVGADRVRSRVLQDDEDVSKIVDGESVFVIEVPEEFRKDFERDVENSLRDIAGIPTVAVHPLIQKREKIDAMFDETRIHPFTVYEWNAGEPADFLWDALVETKEGFSKPLVNPNAVRHAHLDLALTRDAVGICVAHVAGKKAVLKRNVVDLKETVEVLPIIYVDFILRIVPPKFGEILLSDVRSIIYQMIDHGFRIHYITCDSFQSADTLQNFRQKGINAEVLSVDTSSAPYEVLKAAIYEDRINCYRYDILAKELKEVERDVYKNKIIHPAMGSKDVADSLAGVVYTLTVKRGFVGDLLKPSLGYVEDKFQWPIIPSDMIFKDDDEDDEKRWYNIGKFL